MVDISIIIPVKNDKKIKNCLASITKMTFPKDKYEIIVVDNGSDSYIREITKDFPVTYIREMRPGSYYARNAGLKIAKGKIIAFTDSDCTVDKNWISGIIKEFDHPQVAAVGGKILKTRPTTKIQKHTDALADGQSSLQYLSFYPKPYIVTANAFFKASVLRKLKGFDGTFKSGGDVDMSWRVGLLGYRIKTTNKSIVYHENRETLSGYFKQFFNYSSGHVLLFKKHGKEIDKKFYINVYPLKEAAHLFKHVLTERKINFTSAYLVLIRDLAMVCGNLYGSLKYRTLFI